MNNRAFSPSLRLSATLLLVGQLLYIVVTQFHADGDANNHPAVFAEYAGSGIWTAVHLGQFATMAILSRTRSRGGSSGRAVTKLIGSVRKLPAPAESLKLIGIGAPKRELFPISRSLAMWQPNSKTFGIPGTGGIKRRKLRLLAVTKRADLLGAEQIVSSTRQLDAPNGAPKRK